MGDSERGIKVNDSQRNIVVVGASAGGVEALRQFCAGLPADLAAAVFVVLHLPANAHSNLPAILQRAGPLPAEHARDGEPIRNGRIFIAPTDHHMLLRSDTVRLSVGPRENRQRPAVDPLFRSAAREHGRRVIGVILSGSLDDGASGIRAVKSRGGVALIQKPSDALFDSMPRSALAVVAADDVLPVSDMGQAIAKLVSESVRDEERMVTDDLNQEVQFAEGNTRAMSFGSPPGEPANLGCPECGGTLWRLSEGDLVRFRCRVGHAYSARSLQDVQREHLESALWVALRNLEEQASLARQMTESAVQRNHANLAQRFQVQEQDAMTRVEIVRQALALALNSPGALPIDGSGAGDHNLLGTRSSFPNGEPYVAVSADSAGGHLSSPTGS